VYIRTLTLSFAALMLTAGMGLAVTIDLVPVGNPGNTADTYRMQDGTTGYGSVAYTYSIGKYEVTAGQYTEFLNKVARTDAYGLYNTYMADTVDHQGCNIQRTGSSGNYSYNVDADWANRPVNWVSWGDAARFCNWLQNGQPNTGSQTLATTEDGAYLLNGQTSYAGLMGITRKTNATYCIPSENEWYKAAFYDPSKGGLGVGGYWLYPTKTNTGPSNVLSSTGANNANFYDGNLYPHGWTIDSPYYRTPVGAFESSYSAYGTFDQAGNVEEWNEAILSAGADNGRGLRGGWYNNDRSNLDSSFRSRSDPTYSGSGTGFRIASVPEPGTIAMVLTIALCGLIFWKSSNA
jgi:sulfatase modifying factor 1